MIVTHTKRCKTEVGHVISGHTLALVDSMHTLRGRATGGDIVTNMHPETLAQCCQRERLTPAAYLILAHDILAGVNHLHNMGLVHCDIKPENILVARNGRGILADYDLVQVNNGAGNSTAYGLIYRPPEICHDGETRDSPIGPAADVWAAGIVLYYMKYGTALFSRVGAGLGADSCVIELYSRLFKKKHVCTGRCATPAWMAALTRDDLRRKLRMQRCDVDNIILDMLRPNPDDRISSALALQSMAIFAAKYIRTTPARPTRAFICDAREYAAAVYTAYEDLHGVEYDHRVYVAALNLAEIVINGHRIVDEIGAETLDLIETLLDRRIILSAWTRALY